MRRESVVLKPIDGTLAERLKLYLNLRGMDDEISTKTLRKLSPQELQYILDSPKLGDYVL